MSDEAPNSSLGPRLVNNVCFIGAGFVGESLLLMLDRKAH